MKDIIAIFKPKVELSSLDIIDNEFGSGTYKPTGNEYKASNAAGSYSPFISINNFIFQGQDIKYLELDLMGFIPRIIINIKDAGGIFTSKAYPKDGDLISLLIKSDNRDFKPIRQDYRILDVISNNTSNDRGDDNTYIIEAILELPEIFIDRIKSFPFQTSSEVLQSIARELKLGFATNETMFNDRMTWLCPSISYDDFILNDVMAGSYKDDESFFISYIDQYYYMNMVEMNSLYTHDLIEEETTITSLMQGDYMPNDDRDNKKFLVNLFLSNTKELSGTAHYIRGFNPLNNSGMVSLKNGYRTYIQYYDKKNAAMNQYFIETLNTIGSDDKIILKGRKDEDHTTRIKMVNVDYQVNDVVHENYNHAKVQNKRNNEELKKFYLQVSLDGISPNVHRNKTLPIFIFNDIGSDIRTDATKDNEGKESKALDKFLSGYYNINGMKYIYSFEEKRFFTQVLASKRELEI